MVRSPNLQARQSKNIGINKLALGERMSIFKHARQNLKHGDELVDLCSRERACFSDDVVLAKLEIEV